MQRQVSRCGLPHERKSAYRRCALQTGHAASHPERPFVSDPANDRSRPMPGVWRPVTRSLERTFSTAPFRWLCAQARTRFAGWVLRVAWCVFDEVLSEPLSPPEHGVPFIMRGTSDAGFSCRTARQRTAAAHARRHGDAWPAITYAARLYSLCGCCGRAGKVEPVTGVAATSSRPVRTIVLIGG